MHQAPLEALRGGDLMCNQTILEELLKGRGSQAQNEVVAFNTALVLWVAGVESDFRHAAQKALAALAQGSPWSRMEQLRDALSPAKEE